MLLEQKFKNTICKYDLLKKDDRVIAAVSGGPDSVCLLVLLAQLKKELDLYLHVVSFNHLIRKKEAYLDTQFVKVLAQKYNLPITIGEADVPKFAKEKKLSLEESARIARFYFLKETAMKNRINKIALGHNCDDQVETFLMRLIRGSGLLGLCGISAKRKEDDFEFIRPLIDISREEIEAFLKQKKIDYRIDKTNFQIDLFRNKVRLELIPLLEKEYNPAIKTGLLRTIHNISEAYQLIESQVEIKARNSIQKKGTQAVLDLAEFALQPWIIQTQLLRRAFSFAKGDLKQLSYEHLTALQKLAEECQSGKHLTLPAGITASKIYKTIVFDKRPAIEKKTLEKEKKIVFPGVTEVKELEIKISAEFLEKCSLKKEATKWTEFFDAEKVKYPLFVCTRKEKDMFSPLGLQGRKSLKEFFIDEKVPLSKRNKIPVIRDKEKIIWVAGLRISDEVKITQQTKRILKLEIIN